MGCILALVALAFPRFVILLLVVFSDYIGRAFSGEWWWPLLGFLFMPFTTLAFAATMNEHGSIGGVWILLIALAVLLDLGVIGGSGKKAGELRSARRRDALD